MNFGTWDQRELHLTGAAAAMCVCVLFYLPGIVGFMLVTGRDFPAAFSLVAATFIPVDLIKCVAAALLSVPLGRALR